MIRIFEPFYHEKIIDAYPLIYLLANWTTEVILGNFDGKKLVKKSF
jgi:hypothetical protein